MAGHRKARRVPWSIGPGLLLFVAAIVALVVASRATANAPVVLTTVASPAVPLAEPETAATPDYSSLVFVFVLSTFIGLGVIARVSRLLHTPLMSLTNAISAIAVVGSILVTGADHPVHLRWLGAVALFASTTNIVSGFLITDRMLKMFKQSKPAPAAGTGAKG